MCGGEGYDLCAPNMESENMSNPVLSDDEIEGLVAEINYCRQAQSWSPRSVRTSWYPKLQAILDATDEEVPAAKAVARAEAFRLATEVASSLVDFDWILDRIEVYADERPEVGTIADAVAWCRERGIEIFDGQQGARDGLNIGPSCAEVYATCRGWLFGDCDWVSIDLLTGDVTNVEGV